MVKAVERTAKIENIRLIEKRGGRSGDIKNE
jgi:molybdenum cofactor biosynthesis enzyme